MGFDKFSAYPEINQIIQRVSANQLAPVTFYSNSQLPNNLYCALNLGK